MARATARAKPQNEDVRGANRPSDIAKHGWWVIFKRVWGDLSEKNVSLIAAGTAFYAFLAIPAAFSALISVYGLLFDPADVEQQVRAMQGAVPADAIGLISGQLKPLSAHSTALGIGFVVSMAIALGSASSGTSSIMQALNMVHGEEERRGFIKYYAMALGLTVGMVIFAALALALIAVLPAAIEELPFGGFGNTLAAIARWPVLLVLVMLWLAAIYRLAPSREAPKWRWISAGTVAAALLWIAGSALFSLYVGAFATYNKTYGSLGAVVVLLMWLWVSAYAVLIGATLNAEIERQTRRDNTTGAEPAPMGAHGAEVADAVARESSD